MKMTNKNKLPVVGKRYKYKGAMTEDCFRSFMTSGSKFIFSEHFEELPDQEPTTKESLTVDNDDLTTAQDLLTHPNTQETPVSSIVGQTRDIVSAKTDKVGSIWKPISELPEDGGDVYIKFESSGIIVQSIYHRNHYKGGLQDGKPAIEFIGSDTAYIEDLELDDTETFKYIMLTDFINQQISLEERITKLENK